MENLWTFFGFSIIFYLLCSINGEPFNGTDWLTEISDPMYEKQLQNLKLENEKLKLRLELVELNMMKQQNHNIKTESKWERIEDHMKKLDQQLTSLILNISANTINAKEDIQAGSNLSPMDDAGKNEMSIGKCLPGKEENGGQPVDMNITQNMFKDIQSTLAKIENKYSTPEPLLELIKEEQAMLTMIGKDNPMTCIRNSDNKLVCTDVDLPTSCANCSNNSCLIQNHLLSPKSFMVPCNDTTDGGDWTVIQRRVSDSVDFYRDWSEYKQGFGDLDGNYWIGLDKLHALTTTLAPVELRIELMDFNNVVKYAKYHLFIVGDESTKYILQNVDGYSGTAGDSFSDNKGMMFTTRDQDNDKNASDNCADFRHGAWWYESCSYSNLNGQYNVGSSDSGQFSWYAFNYNLYSLKFGQMMIRPKKL